MWTVILKMVFLLCSGARNNSMGFPKKKGTVHFRRSPDGHVVGEIVNQDGQVEVQKDFGKFSEAEYDRLFQIIRHENPDMEIQDVELTGN